MPYNCITVERGESRAILTMNRPQVMNALNVEMVQEIYHAMDALASDQTIRGVILQGAGDNFCSGADMSLFSQGLSAPAWLSGMKEIGRMIRRIREVPQPIISKVRGVAYGGGANLALSGDFVVASHHARICENFVNIGIIVDAGGTHYLPRLVGLGRAREMALLGQEMDGRTAASIGLIYKSVPDEELDGEVDSLAKALAQKSWAAVALIKEGLDRSLDMSLEETLEWEAAHQSIVLQSEEHKGAVKLFLKSRGKSVG
jgi:2-(1,2-epoxy-1,2-dihydrophenyl)acetyl-CoA isomerase